MTVNFFSPLAGIFAQDPTLRLVQIGLLFIGALIVFLLLFTARDIILRTRSFLLQFFCIVLVAVLPGIGFLIYLLIRPSRTLKERELHAEVLRIAEMLPLLLPEDATFGDEDASFGLIDENVEGTEGTGGTESTDEEKSPAAEEL